MQITRKLCASPQATATADKMITRAVFSEEIVDRDGEVIAIDGLETDEYLTNPVILLGHSFSDPPVGRCTRLEKRGRTLEGEVQWAATPRGLEMAELYHSGFMKSFSIGFMGQRDSGPATQKELMVRPSWAGASKVYRRSKLYEISAVCIPSNPAALARAMQTGALVLSKSMARQLGLATELPPGVVPFMTARELEKALKQQLRGLTGRKLFRKRELRELMEERIRVSEGKVC